MVQSTFYVNSETGSDRHSGDSQNPWKTITYALKQATSGNIIQLAPGTYNTANGELFPLIIPPGVTLMGNEINQGKEIIIEGTGEYQSPSFKKQQITLFVDNLSEIRGLTITNNYDKGTGIWIESTSPLIINNIICNCGREGIFITGKAKPIIQNNVFVENGASGIFLVRNAKGEIRRNLCHNTGCGIAVTDQAAPLISDNRVINNQVGILLSKNACPVLRRNLIEKNIKSGLTLKGEAQPDFGSVQDPAGNILKDNEGTDLYNETKLTLVSVGNLLFGSGIEGNVEFLDTFMSQNVKGPAEFSDISNHWAENFIEALIKRDFIRGFPDDSFKPEASLTRAEYATLIAKTFDFPRKLGSGMGDFQDIDPQFWAAKAIQKATAMGFLVGFPDGTFRPQANLTRVQAIVSLIKGLGLIGGNPSLLLAYSDRSQIPSYATNAIAIATQRGLIVNYPHLDKLEPMREIKRSEIAALLYQALVITQKAPLINSPYIVDPDPYLPSFKDIEHHWAKNFIRRLASLDFISGFPDSSFKPDQPLTRSQYAALLVKAFNPGSIRPETRFFDVAKDCWAYSQIQQAYQGGFLSGFPDQTFHPQQNLKRIHLIISLVNGLGLPPNEDLNLELYQDYLEIPLYAQSSIKAATKAGIVVNYPKKNQLKPNQEITRAEAIAMIYQALVYQDKLPGIHSGYIV
jgi:parallel beta-helix repeat protein